MMYLAAALALLLVIDWLQTLRIAREPAKWFEAWNIILPRHPSPWQVHLWFASVGGVLWAVWEFLPYARFPVFFVVVCIEVACVVNNFRKGLWL